MELININPILDDVLEIYSQNKCWDLRNDVDFLKVSYNVIEKSAILIWQFPSDWYLKQYKIKESKKFLEFYFENVDFFEIDSSDIYGLKSDIIVLEGIHNYYEKKDGTIENNNFITFIFGNGLKVIIKADILRFQVISSFLK